MKALVLSCATGQGHNSAGLAVAEELFRRNIPCDTADPYGGGRTSRVVNGAYLGVVSHVPWLFRTIYGAGELIRSTTRKSPVYLANKASADALKNRIIEGGYDTILCPHLFPAETLTYLRSRGELPDSVACYAIATDYACIPFWEETQMDLYFTPHADLNAEFAEKGVPADRLCATGIPVSRRFELPPDKIAAQKALRIPNGAVALIMTGSMGYGHISTLTRRLCAADVYTIVLVGHNDGLRRKLEDEFSGESLLRAVSFTDDVARYMEASDVVLSKPGGLSSTEAAVRGVPLVLTAPIPGCETINAKFFTRCGMAVSATGENDAADAAIALLRDGGARQAMIDAQRRTLPPGAAARVVDILLARAQERSNNGGKEQC